MRPTLPNPAVLLVEPYRGRRIRRGDVVLLSPPDSSETVVHRVISISENRLVTKGDANRSPDPWEPAPEAVTGKVCFVCTPNGLRRIYGGRLGILTAAVVTVRRLATRVAVAVLRPLLPAMARQRLVSRLWTLLWRPKAVCFNRYGESSLLLLARGRTIGRFDPEQGTWSLIRPFSTFVDVEVLPRPKLPLS